MILRFCLYLGFTISSFIMPQGFCASLLSRGAVVSLPLGAISKPGFLVEDIGAYYSEPDRVKSSTNIMANVGVIEYTTKT